MFNVPNDHTIYNKKIGLMEIRRVHKNGLINPTSHIYESIIYKFNTYLIDIKIFEVNFWAACAIGDKII